MGPWGQEEKEDLGKDEKRGGWVGQSEMVTEMREGLLSLRCGRRFAAAQEEQYLVLENVPKPAVGRCSCRRVLGIIRLRHTYAWEPHLYQESH